MNISEFARQAASLATVSGTKAEATCLKQELSAVLEIAAVRAREIIKLSSEKEELEKSIQASKKAIRDFNAEVERMRGLIDSNSMPGHAGELHESLTKLQSYFSSENHHSFSTSIDQQRQ